MPKACLTPDLVDEIGFPVIGEVWVADTQLTHFGVRVWAGKRGGGKAYAIRLRDQFGIVVRESYRPERDYRRYYWEWERAWEKSLGYFLDRARAWASDRIAIHVGHPTSQERVDQRRSQRKARILSTSINVAFDRKIARLRRQSQNHLYLDQIASLIDKHIPLDIRRHTFRDVPIRRLADAISSKSISYGNVRTLRACVSGVFKDAAGSYGRLGHKLESIQRRCVKNLDARRSPPHPKILDITESDYQRFFEALEANPHWQQALAIRLYFATGARLQVVLRARWSDIVEGTWYPFLPGERGLWFESKERLGPDARKIIALLEERHGAAGLSSSFLFPSPSTTTQPIKTVQRYWSKYAAEHGWNGLPLSHVVVHHNLRSNPSYSLFFHRTYLRYDRLKVELAVSKVANRRSNSTCNAGTYR